MTGEEICKLASAGDEDAAKLLAALFQFVHVQDDLVDRDHPVSPEQVVTGNLWLMWSLGKNPFFEKHRDFLWPVLVTSGLAWEASERYHKSGDPVEQVVAHVLKSEYFNFAVAVAFCCGGLPLARRVSDEARNYHFD